MFNKPIILSILISIVFICCSSLSSLIDNKFYSFLFCTILFFSFVFYVGFSHAKKFNEKMAQKNKVKISLYYFVFWFVFVSLIVVLLVMNTTLKDVPLFDLNKKQIFILLEIFLMNFSVFSIYSLVIYYALGLGCKFSLSKNDHKKT